MLPQDGLARFESPEATSGSFNPHQVACMREGVGAPHI